MVHKMVGLKCGLNKMPQDEIQKNKKENKDISTKVFALETSFLYLFALVFVCFHNRILELIQWTLLI